MRALRVRKLWLATLCAAAMALVGGAASAQAAFNDPISVFFPLEGEKAKTPPPYTGFQNACGLTLDISSSLYVSDYYHNNIDAFNASFQYTGQQTSVVPDSGPCALAFDSSSRLYVNNYHSSIVRYTLALPFNKSVPIGSGTVIDSNHSNGFVVDTKTSNPLTTDNVYVNDRTYIAAYEPSGAPIMVGPDPLKIGEGTLGDGYGLAISRFGPTSGLLYAADASDNTVKVYNQVLNAPPVMTISGPPGGFHSLVDSAIAIDNTTGEIYVTERVGNTSTDRPESVVQVFDTAGVYVGRLKYAVIDGLPVGITINNSSLNQGRVYVTSGNSVRSSIYTYPPEAASNVGLPASSSLKVVTKGTGGGAVTSSTPAGIDCSGVCSSEFNSGGAIPLTATADPGSTFVGWSGAECSGTDSCVVTMDEAKSVSAEFAALPAAPTSSGSGPSPAPAAAVATTSSSSAKVKSRGKHRHRAKKHRHRAKHRR